MLDHKADSGSSTIREQAAYWLTRLNSGECTEEDRLRLDDWLGQDERHRAEFDRARSLWRRLGQFRAEDIPQMAAARGRAAFPGSLLAASVAVFGVVGLLAILWLAGGGESRTIYQTAKGEQLNVTLADGSDMRINTDTTLGVAYTERSRTIHLDRGEALFTVEPGDDRPFEVIAADGQIRDLGTRFSVHREGDRVSVVVLEGTVTVKTRQASFRRPVRVGERMSYDVSGNISAIEKVDAEAMTAWTRGRLVFDGVTLTEMAGQIARYHDVRIVIDDHRVSQLRVSGTFRTDDLDTMINTLQIILPVRVERPGPGYIRLVGDS